RFELEAAGQPVQSWFLEEDEATPAPQHPHYVGLSRLLDSQVLRWQARFGELPQKSSSMRVNLPERYLWSGGAVILQVHQGKRPLRPDTINLTD
ncbi:hypothetical protein WG66_002131, partial [Moniliophthora roreri]